jgi:transcriptional regulator with XRE-family HTH domain
MKNEAAIQEVKPSVDCAAVGARVMDVRKRLGLSQYSVCKTIGINHGALRRFEEGRGFCSVPTLVDLAKVYQCSTDWILGLSTDGAPKGL